ncbi:MAG: putative AAA-ATPase [Firmicutes bacterium ADurb.BinA205]|nr:MAG: putative AAA-ATPase [Firmicutes bacterium ADurb.BinA205]
MGIYLNPDNIDFQRALNSEIYVDKTELIKYTNKVLNTEQQFICVSRPRRFGKSMAGDMLAAYYSKGCDSKEMFSKYKISADPCFEKHLNKYNVIHINMVNFLGESKNIDEMIQFISDDIIDEVIEQYPDLNMPRRKTLLNVLNKAFAQFKIPFIFIIDEWDCIFRELKNEKESQEKYLDFLRDIMKDQSYVALAYMTGILPIKKYGKHSALNMFTEIAMTNAVPIQEFTGFTENEVIKLCKEYKKDFNEVKRWYDGYTVDGESIYNPKSVVEALTRGTFKNYWTSTENYEALEEFIFRNDDGLRDTVIKLIAGEKKKIDPSTFNNDMVTFNSQDDVLTLLVHLGYLTFDSETNEVAIPNYEVSEQFASTIRNKDWAEVSRSLKVSDELLQSTLNCDAERVAQLISDSHSDNTSILQYNDENSLACVLSISYYSARKDYILHRELPTGKGFADLVFIPRIGRTLPALIIELKKGHSAEEAIQQIKDNNYIHKVSEYSPEIILVGINYDEKKGHTCMIEKYEIK